MGGYFAIASRFPCWNHCMPSKCKTSQLSQKKSEFPISQLVGIPLALILTSTNLHVYLKVLWILFSTENFGSDSQVL